MTVCWFWPSDQKSLVAVSDNEDSIYLDEIKLYIQTGDMRNHCVFAFLLQKNEDDLLCTELNV